MLSLRLRHRALTGACRTSARSQTPFLSASRYRHTIFTCAFKKSALADVLEHCVTDDGHGNTIITDPHNAANTITLDHVNVHDLNIGDFNLL